MEDRIQKLEERMDAVVKMISILEENFNNFKLRYFKKMDEEIERRLQGLEHRLGRVEASEMWLDDKGDNKDLDELIDRVDYIGKEVNRIDGIEKMVLEVAKDNEFRNDNKTDDKFVGKVFDILGMLTGDNGYFNEKIIELEQKIEELNNKKEITIQEEIKEKQEDEFERLMKKLQENRR